MQIGKGLAPSGLTFAELLTYGIGSRQKNERLTIRNCVFWFTKPGKMEVLYIDDDLEDVEIFREELHEIDHAIGFCYAVSADDAFKKLTGNLIRPDIIFIDYHMPVVDGYECIKIIKERNALRNIPIVLVSSTISSRQVDEFNKLGVYYFLSKSALAMDMKPAIKVILDSLCKDEVRISQRNA
jgi:CheY-like chemotaxis protein